MDLGWVVQRFHASFAVSDAAMKTTHHGSEPIERVVYSRPWREAVDCCAAVLADREAIGKLGCRCMRKEPVRSAWWFLPSI